MSAQRQDRHVVARVTADDVSFEMVLPDAAEDYIQSKLASGEVYELELLRDMVQRVPVPALVLDVGANIGGHTCFLAATGRSVVAFEPDQHLAHALCESASLNGFGSRVEVRSVAVGDAPGSAELFTPDRTNLGTQRLLQAEREEDADADADAGGTAAVTVLTLDQQAYPDRVSALKIDVEGMEMAVLQGARQLLAQDRPLIYVELLDAHQFETAHAWLLAHGYEYAATFNVSPTHLFVPSELGSDDSRAAATVRMAERMYAAERDLGAARSRLREANAKYRDVTARAAELEHGLEEEQRRAADAAARVAQLEHELVRNRRSSAILADLPVIRSWIREAQEREIALQARVQELEQRERALLLAARELRAAERDAAVRARRSEAERKDVELRLHALADELARVEERLRATIVESDQLRGEAAEGRRASERLAALTRSRTMLVGVAVREALASPRAMLRLPAAIVSAARRAPHSQRDSE